MSSTVFALTLASAVLISCVNSENAYIYAYQEHLNDSSFLSLKGLRNEVRQGDAITYELGTPQYQILNADEPIEIITAGQPGYYESLRRYEQAMKKPKTQGEESNTQKPKEAELQHATEQTEAPVALNDKKIKFIILNSKKQIKGGKKQVGEAKSKHTQDATLAESRDNDEILKPKKCKYKKLVEKSQSSKIFTFGAEMDRPTLDEQANKNNMASAIADNFIQQSNNNQTILQHFSTSTTPQPMQEMKMSERTTSTTQATILTRTSHPAVLEDDHTNNEPITAGSMQYEPLSAIPTPFDAFSDLPSMFFVDEARISDLSQSYQNDNTEGLHAADMNSKYSYYEAPPHIRDFEYLYRSALGMNE